MLHPAAIAPAVQRRIPVRVLCSVEPEAAGTRIVDRPAEDASPLVAVAWRGGVQQVRVTSRKPSMDTGFVPRVLEAFALAGCAPDLVVASNVALTLVVPEPDLQPVGERLHELAELEASEPSAILTVVGNGLATDPAVRNEVLSALAAISPDLVTLGGSSQSASAVVDEQRVDEVVKTIHRRFFE